MFLTYTNHIQLWKNRGLLLLFACRLVSMQEADKKMTMIFLKLHKRYFISMHVLRLGNTLLHLVHVNSGIICTNCTCYNTQKGILLSTIMYNVCL